MENKTFVVSIVGSEEIGNQLKPVFDAISTVDFRFIHGIYENFCLAKGCIEESDILILDSSSEIYCPSFFYKGKNKKTQCHPYISFNNKDGRVTFDTKEIVERTGLYDFMHDIGSIRTKKLLIFTPDLSEINNSATSELSALKETVMNTANGKIVLTPKQRRLTGGQIYHDIFSFLFADADKGYKKDYYNHKGLYPVLPCNSESPLLYDAYGDRISGIEKMITPLGCHSDLDTRLKWKYKIYSHYAYREDYHDRFDRNYGKDSIPTIYIQKYPYSNDIMEKRSAILAHLLSIESIECGFTTTTTLFDDLLVKYNTFKMKGDFSGICNSKVDELRTFYPFCMKSPVTIPLKREIIIASQVKDANVLIYGETGTGKESVAELIHYKTFGVGNKNIKKINCALIDKNLATSLLFGHVKGAYTGAANDTQGIVRKANNGTLFLDEIHYLPAETLGKLLRFMEDGLVTKLGSTNSIYCKVKILAATHSNEFINNKMFNSMGLIQRFHFKVFVPPVRFRFSKEIEWSFPALLYRARIAFEKSKNVKISRTFMSKNQKLNDFNRHLCDCLNVEDEVDKYEKNTGISFTPEELSAIHSQFFFMKYLGKCYIEAWKNSNMRGIFNYILGSLVDYEMLHPDIVYERNTPIVKDSKIYQKRISPPGRKVAAHLGTLYSLMTHPEMKTQGGVNLQKAMMKQFKAYKNKGNLNCFLQREKYKCVDDEKKLEMIEEMRSFLRRGSCYEDYPDYPA